MSIIIAMDLSSHIGYARGQNLELEEVMTIPFDSFTYDFGSMAYHFAHWLDNHFKLHKPDLLVLEKPFMRGASTYQQFGLSWTAHMVAYDHKIKRKEYAPSTLKKFFTGNWKATKAQMIAESFKRGHPVDDDHQADAVALFYLGQKELCDGAA